MNFRNFSETRTSVSEIGLGCWQLGGDWGDVDDYTAQKVLEGAVQSGINSVSYTHLTLPTTPYV